MDVMLITVWIIQFFVKLCINCNFLDLVEILKDRVWFWNFPHSSIGLCFETCGQKWPIYNLFRLDIGRNFEKKCNLYRIESVWNFLEEKGGRCSVVITEHRPPDHSMELQRTSLPSGAEGPIKHPVDLRNPNPIYLRVVCPLLTKPYRGWTGEHAGKGPQAPGSESAQPLKIPVCWVKNRKKNCKGKEGKRKEKGKKCPFWAPWFLGHSPCMS